MCDLTDLYLRLILFLNVLVGPPEGTLEDQWKQLDKAMELGILEFAPDDEIIGETLSCQSELLQQMTANRLAAANLLKKIVEQLPQLKEEWKAKDALADEILGAVEVCVFFWWLACPFSLPRLKMVLNWV